MAEETPQLRGPIEDGLMGDGICLAIADEHSSGTNGSRVPHLSSFLMPGVTDGHMSS